MTEDDPRLALIRDNRQLAVREFGRLSDREFGLDRESVAWVEGFIERHRNTCETDDPLVSILGSYLGEAIIAAAGGQWSEHENGSLGVRFSAGNWCFPFNKVAKQFEQGLNGGESILGFYSISVDMLAKGKLSPAAGDEKAKGT